MAEITECSKSNINVIKSMNDNNKILIGSEDSYLRILSLISMKIINCIQLKRKIIHSIAILNNFNLIAVGGIDLSKFSIKINY